MKKVYASYCALETLYVDDDVSNEDILNLLYKEYAKRGFDMDKFDDGEFEVLEMENS